MDSILIFSLSLGFFIVLTVSSYFIIQKTIKLPYLMTAIGSIVAILMFLLVMIAPQMPYAISIFYTSMSLFNGSIVSFFFSRKFLKDKEREIRHQKSKKRQ